MGLRKENENMKIKMRAMQIVIAALATKVGLSDAELLDLLRSAEGRARGTTGGNNG